MFKKGQPNISENNVDALLETAAVKINEEVKINPSFQYQLRRALLNSSFYQPNLVFKKYYQYLYKNKTAVVAGAACSALLLVNILGPKFYDSLINQTTPKTVEKVIAEKLPADYLQDLYHFGYINYVREDASGNHIFKTSVQSKKDIELVDSQPYDIELLLAN